MTKRPTSSWPLRPAKPERVGLCSIRLRRVDDYVGGLVERRLIAGAITLIARRGRLAHLRCHGMMDAERGVAMREDAIFRLYSMTKPIVCVATLMLVEQGLIALHDPVSRWLPALAAVRVAGPDGTLVEPRRQLTVHDLLTHTGGLTYALDYAQRNSGDSAAFIAAVARLPLAAQPGERWNYSLSNDVLGCLIEQLTGERLDAALSRMIFKPLGMRDTAFTVPPAKRTRFTVLYRHDEANRIVRRDDEEHPYLGEPSFCAGGSGLAGTTADYLRFALMLLRGGELDGVRLLSPKTVELMRQDHLPPGHPPIMPFRFGYGYGVSVVRSLAEKQGLGSVGEFGWGGAAGTNCWIDPQEDMVSMVMYQLKPANVPMIDHRVKTILTQAIVG